MKTYKRELAVAILVWFMYVVEVKDVSVVELLVWPTFTFVALAFGLDWINKSGDRLQRTIESVTNSKSSSERTGSKGSNTDGR